ncbi:hypothetical protein WN944_027684 [Citrus x changshan-huyou]|uniref:Uncharacterized protein n=1 Tax=Citrus x changshan-huyou TaxID=2935761 RepID=A0AAP0LKF3_9ROSI
MTAAAATSSSDGYSATSSSDGDLATSSSGNSKDQQRGDKRRGRDSSG